MRLVLEISKIDCKNLIYTKLFGSSTSNVTVTLKFAQISGFQTQLTHDVLIVLTSV